MTTSPWGAPILSVKPRPWRVGTRLLGGDRPLIMGIVNVTPDSFFDGGQHASTQAAVDFAERLLADGADILDIGGESSRPGAEPVSIAEECARVVPVIAECVRRFSAIVSVDTVKSEVARAALDAGALIVNDISGGEFDPRILELPAAFGAGFVANHMQGTPRTMQARPRYENVVDDVKRYLHERIQILAQLGLSADRIAVDPGIGFGKTVTHNYDLIEHLESLDALGCPILLGHSRKSFIAKTPGLEESDRLHPGVAVAVYAALKGVSILRVHDVKPVREALRMIEAIRSLS
jgi:dihydropteroate synthase